VEVEQMSYWLAEVRDGVGVYLEVMSDRDRAFGAATRRETDPG
jgi:hypothetical protein